MPYIIIVIVTHTVIYIYKIDICLPQEVKASTRNHLNLNACTITK